MARHLPLLDATQRRAFDQPPVFNPPQRQLFFALPDWATRFLDTLLAPHSRGGFVLQVGYFKATGRFFPIDRFLAADQAYVQQHYRLGAVEWARYDKVTRFYHREQILQQFGVPPFEQVEAAVRQQVTHFARQQMNPVAVFHSAADYIRTHRWEVPTYAALAGLVTEAFRTVEQQLITQLAHHLTPAVRQQLDALFTTPEEAPAHSHRPYRLTTLKRSLELMRPMAIRANVQDYAVLQTLFTQVYPVVQALDLSEEVVRFYARYVERTQVFQVQQQADKKYLMVLCFVVYQYYQVGDLLTETLLQAVQTHRNAAQRETQARVYRQQQDSASQLRQVLEGVVSHGAALAQLEEVAFSFARTNAEKVTALLAWLQTPAVADFAQLGHTAQQLRQGGGGSRIGPYYQVVEERSRALQRRLGEILRTVAYEGAADSPLAQALAQYRARDGQVSAHPPTTFLKAAERAALAQAESPVSLYKALLAGHVADHLKAGKLNLAHSLRYRPFDTYLLEATTWERQRDALLAQTDLVHLRQPGPWLAGLQAKLATAFARTCERLDAGTNPGVRARANGRPRFLTPARPLDEDAPVARPLFPGPGLISLHEVLHTVNQQCHFTSCLTHWSPRNRPPRPAERVFFAGLMAYGCNLGLTRMAHATKHVALATLENAVNWYFSLDNLRQANELILAFTRQLRLREAFRRSPDVLHSSSDGQKYDLAVDSLAGSASFKYFGNRRGLTAYSYVDETLLVFDSTVFSAADREATHLLEGLLRHAVRPTDVHSTDTHGYTEVIFAVTRLLGIAYEPRIRQLTNQQLYSWEPVATHRQLGQTLLPDARLDPERIARHWDEVLRLVVTLKLRHSEASRLFGRLNSYARQHPLYRALKELGRLVKTEFLLRYVDQVELRQRIQKQLNKGESAHRLAHAVWHGRNQEFHAATRSEQLVAETCKRLLMNAIICWNYLHLSQHLARLPPEQQAATLATLSPFAVLSYRHLNLHGEYDFSDHPLLAEAPFDMDLIATWQPPSKPA